MGRNEEVKTYKKYGAENELQHIITLENHACARIRELQRKKSKTDHERNVRIDKMITRIKLDLVELTERRYELTRSLPEWRRQLIAMGGRP